MPKGANTTPLASMSATWNLQPSRSSGRSTFQIPGNPTFWQVQSLQALFWATFIYYLTQKPFLKALSWRAAFQLRWQDAAKANDPEIVLKLLASSYRTPAGYVTTCLPLYILLSCCDFTIFSPSRIFLFSLTWTYLLEQCWPGEKTIKLVNKRCLYYMSHNITDKDWPRNYCLSNYKLFTLQFDYPLRLGKVDNIIMQLYWL